MTYVLFCALLQCSCVSKQVRVQLATSADNVTLLAFAAELRPGSNQSMSPGRQVHRANRRSSCSQDIRSYVSQFVLAEPVEYMRVN